MKATVLNNKALVLVFAAMALTAIVSIAFSANVVELVRSSWGNAYDATLNFARSSWG